MKRGFLVLFTLFQLVWAVAQEQRITYNSENKDLIDVFNDLEQEFDIHFAYAVDEVKDKKANINAKDEPISSFLNNLLTALQLSFEIVEKDFISITRTNIINIQMSISDSTSFEKLPFATARIKGTDRGYLADVNGDFKIQIDSKDTSILEVSFLGYQKKEIDLSKVDPTQVFEIKLSRDAQELEEIVIKEYLNSGITIDDKSSRISIDVQDMEILPGLSERDILLSSQILAGVGSADESAGGLNIRGSSRDNSILYWNKIPMYQPAHYFGNISAFIPSSVGSMDIYKNHVPVQYGGSSSGLILINSREPKIEEIIAESNLNMTHGDLFTSIPFANYNGRVSIGARRSFNDVLATPTFNSISDKLFDGSLTENVQGITDDFEYNSKLVFNDLNFVLDYAPSGKSEFSLSALSSRSKLDYNSVDEEDEVQSVQTHNVKTFGSNFSWNQRWMDKLSSEFSASYADYTMDYALSNIRNEDEGRANDTQIRSNDLKNLESRLTFSYSFEENHLFKTGYQFNHIVSDLTINEDYFFEDDFTESISSKGDTHGLFLDYFGKFNSGIQLGGGLRFNRYNDLDQHAIDRQLRLNYELNPSLLLKSSAGVYHQYISSLKEVDFVFSNTIEQNWITPDPDENIPVIKNEQVVAGFLFTKNGWMVDLDAYIKRVSSPVARNFSTRLEEEDGVISGKETIKGLDLTLKKRWKYYRAWISYSFQDSNVEALESSFTSGLNLRHQLQFSHTLNYKKFEFSAGYTLRSGLPITNAIGFGEVNDEDDSYFEILYDEVNSSRLPTYHRFDVSAWYKFKSKRGLSGQIGVSILNLFNKTNFYSRTFSIEEDDEDSLFLLRSDRKFIGITPNISLNIRF